MLLLCVLNHCVNLQGGYNNGGYGYRPSYNGAGYAGAGMGSGGAYRGGRSGAEGSQMNNQANPLWAAQGYPVTGPGGSVPTPCLCAFCLSSAIQLVLGSFSLYSSVGVLLQHAMCPAFGSRQAMMENACPVSRQSRSGSDGRL